jgi:hypothetical protein
MDHDVPAQRLRSPHEVKADRILQPSGQPYGHASRRGVLDDITQNRCRLGRITGVERDEGRKDFSGDLDGKRPTDGRYVLYPGDGILAVEPGI